jgi:transposase
MPVMIGVDPHKASHTAAALDEHGQLLGQQRVPATLDGYQRLRRWAGRWPQRCWAVEGAHGIGRAVAQRLVGDGEQVMDVPAKLAARVRVLSVGHGRKSDLGGAVSVAVAARRVPQLRQVGVEDQAAVLHLLTKRRQDLVAARTQTINRLHRLLTDLVPGAARRNLTANRAAALLNAVTPTGAPAVTRWQLAGELVADVRHWSSESQQSRRVSRPRSPSPTPACSGCSASGRCWPPPSWARSATFAGSRPSIISPPTPAPPHWRPLAARSSATGCRGPGTAS